METKRYSTIDYSVLRELDVSVSEMAYIDMVYYLSKAGSEWCYKSLESIAADLNMGKSSIFKMRERLTEKKLLIRGATSQVKTSEIVHESYGVRKVNERSLSEQNVRKVNERSKTNTKNTIESNNRNINTNVLIGETPTYGNEDINELFNYWETIVGYKVISKRQANRRACHNLVKRHGVTGVQQLIRVVNAAQHNQYAPKVSDFCDLQAKLNQLLRWAKESKPKERKII